MTNIQIVIIHLMAILMFVIHHTVIEYNRTQNISRLQLGNDNPETLDTRNKTFTTISFETILIARSNILLRWSRRGI